MNWLKPSWQAVLAIALCLVALALGAMSKPEAAALADPTASFDYNNPGHTYTVTLTVTNPAGITSISKSVTTKP